MQEESDIVQQLLNRNLGKGNLERRAADVIKKLRQDLRRTTRQAAMWRALMRAVPPAEAERLTQLALGDGAFTGKE